MCFISLLCLEFQRRVLYLLTKIRDNIQQVSKKYEPPESDFHIEKADTLEQFNEIMDSLSDEDNRNLLVSKIFLCAYTELGS